MFQRNLFGKNDPSADGEVIVVSGTQQNFMTEGNFTPMAIGVISRSADWPSSPHWIYGFILRGEIKAKPLLRGSISQGWRRNYCFEL